MSSTNSRSASSRESNWVQYQLGLLQFSSRRASLGFVRWGPLFELDESQPLRHFVRVLAQKGR